MYEPRVRDIITSRFDIRWTVVHVDMPVVVLVSPTKYITTDVNIEKYYNWPESKTDWIKSVTRNGKVLPDFRFSFGDMILVDGIKALFIRPSGNKDLGLVIYNKQKTVVHAPYSKMKAA